VDELAVELTDDQRRELAAALEALRDELATDVERTGEGSKPVDLDEPIGRLSRMEAMQQQQMAAANRRSLKIRLDQVRAALERIASDDYGLCLECEEPIAYKRLAARPESRFCLRCKQGREKR
jgi:DnaK suppressor protein